MFKYILVIFIILAKNAVSTPANETLLSISRVKGTTVYTSCILTPPVTPQQVTLCSSLYAQYISSLQTLNAPLPIIVSTDPSPYVWSPYDVCRFETTHLVFDFVGTQPYCPAL